MGNKHEDMWAKMLAHVEELHNVGLEGDALMNQLMSDFAPEKTGWKPGLHDLFAVSDEEEADWYDMSSRRIRSFDGLMKELEEQHTLDVRIGYIRKAFRSFSAECRSFFTGWLSMLDGICQDNDLGDNKSIGRSTLITFESVCYFAAEYHATELFDRILSCINGLHRSDSGYMPISDFVYQHLTSVFYAVFGGDFEDLMDSLLSLDQDEEIRTRLGHALLQFVLDGVFSEEKGNQMLDEYLQFIFDEGADGDAAAHWIVRTGQTGRRKKELRKLLTDHVNPMYYGTTDPVKFEKMVRQREETDCHKGLVMDDMILFGMYPKAIHAPKEIRNRAILEQDKRIREMKKNSASGIA